MIADAPSAAWLLPFLRGDSLGLDRAPLNTHSPLESWRGVGQLKKLLLKPFDANDDALIYLASRTTTLMRLGLQCLFQSSRRCLPVDLTWSGFLRDLKRIAAHRDASIAIAPIQDKLLKEHATQEQICSELTKAFLQYRCDSLFLPVVDHLGILLPVRQIVESIQASGGEIRFVLLDAAQAFGHIPMSDASAIADMIVAGTHKWLGSYFPLGVCVAPNRYSQEAIERTIAASVQKDGLDDGLMFFVEQLISGWPKRPETANLGPLFSAFGTVHDWKGSCEQDLLGRVRNADAVSRLASQCGWNPIRPTDEFHTGILLLRPGGSDRSVASQRHISEQLDRSSITATVYDDGLTRFALPAVPLEQDELHRLERFFLGKDDCTSLHSSICESRAVYQQGSIAAF
jgi:hypothetical protein